MKRLSLTLTFIFALVCCIEMAGLGTWNAADAAKLGKDVIKVGYVGGLNAVFGKQMLQGAQDAAEEINKTGGVLGTKIQIISADSNMTAVGAASAIARLTTSDKIDYLVGAYTSEEATAFLSESVKRKILTLAHMTTLQFDQAYKANPEAYKYFFAASSSELSSTAPYIDSLPYVVKTLKKELGIQKINVALISDNALWTVNMDKLMTEAIKNNEDATLLYHSKPARNATDFTTEITEIMKKDVHLVIVFGGYGSMIPLIKQYNQMKVPALFTGAIILARNTDDFIKAVGKENAAYVVVGTTCTEVADARSAQFVKEFKRKHNQYPGYYTAEGYNMIKLLATALEKAGTMNQDVLIKTLEQTVVPPQKAWGGTQRFVNHRLVLDYDITKGTRRYIAQYVPEGDRTLVVFPEKGADSKLMIPPHMIKKWKK